MDAAERALLEDTVVAALADPATDADAVLVELGWFEMLDAEPDDAIAVVFGALGAGNRVAAVLDDVVAAMLGIPPHAECAVLLPEFGEWTPPGRIADGGVAASGLTTHRAATARELVVVCTAGTEVGAVTVPTAAAELVPVRGVDPAARLSRARVPLTGAVSSPLDADRWDAAVAAGRRAVAHEIAGACRVMLTLARAHAVERVQFGRPVAAFQAVRHRLAEALVAVEALDATLGAARDQPEPRTAALAKATAGLTARTVGAQSQQVLAGIGFTTDHPFHRYLKRTMLLDGLLGGGDRIATDLGRRLLADRAVPTLIEL